MYYVILYSEGPKLLIKRPIIKVHEVDQVLIKVLQNTIKDKFFLVIAIEWLKSFLNEHEKLFKVIIILFFNLMLP